MSLPAGTEDGSNEAKLGREPLNFVRARVAGVGDVHGRCGRKHRAKRAKFFGDIAVGLGRAIRRRFTSPASHLLDAENLARRGHQFTRREIRGWPLNAAFTTAVSSDRQRSGALTRG